MCMIVAVIVLTSCDLVHIHVRNFLTLYYCVVPRGCLFLLRGWLRRLTGKAVGLSHYGERNEWEIFFQTPSLVVSL
uniref:Secreted protein n=1 Tax=Parascaris univalens TaxID=6257 RepID=A0A915CKX1_PARUN